MHSLQVYIQCTAVKAAAILDLLLPVTFNNVGSGDNTSSEWCDLGILGVATGILTIGSLENEIHEPALKVDR